MDTAATLASRPQLRRRRLGPPGQPDASVTALVRPFGHPLGHLDLLESLAIFIIREVAAESERPVLLFSGGKDSAVLLHLAAKAFKPGKIPFPVLHVDTGHNFPEVLDYRDAQVEAAGRPAHRGQGAGLHRPGPGGRPRSGGLAEPAADHHAARRHQREPLRRRVRRGPPRRGQGEGQRAGALVPRLLRPVGPQAAAARALAALPGQRAAGEHLRAFPLSDFTELDIWQYIRREQHRAALDLLRPRARRHRARRHAARRERVGLAPRAPKWSRRPRCATAPWATPP